MKKNNCFTSATPCSGCGACYAVCSVSAITYSINSNGFYEAHVNENACVSCGKCVQVCPKYIQDNQSLNPYTFPVFSFVHHNQESVVNSSSGAAAWALSELAFEKGYQIVGVEYDLASNTARTSLAKNLTEAQKFRGSKYIQANTQTYKDLLQLPGKFIVFGTPCQIAGLAKASEQIHRRDDFLLVDCFCHGVPSYLVWHKFLAHIAIREPKTVLFRSKTGGWHNYCMQIDGGNKSYTADARTNPFYQLFFSDLLLNDACYTCRAKSSAYADIRLGDFWGSSYDLTETGVSLVIPLSTKGSDWIEKLTSKGNLQRKDRLRSRVLKSQSAFSQTKCKKAQRKILLTALTHQTFEQVLAKYQAGLSTKKNIVNRIKAHLPLWTSKHVRFLIHSIRKI